MFVQNNADAGGNHLSVINAAMQKADTISLCVAYVKATGVNLILQNLEGKNVKLVCSFDMNITQAQGIRQLLAKGAEVKIYNQPNGTFHPKVWIFKGSKEKTALVTSANMTYGGLKSNVEAGIFSDDKEIVSAAEAFFSAQWNSEYSADATEEKLKHLENLLAKMEKIRRQKPPVENADKTSEYLFSFVKSWIDIPKDEKAGLGNLWRGWYVVPDHYLIDDDAIKNLASYLPLIGNKITLDRQNPSAQYQKLLSEFMKQEYAGKKPKLDAHDLFVRRAKNYLIKFGWADHPLNEKRKPMKNILFMSDLGHEVMLCGNDIPKIKKLYSRYFDGFTCYGLRIVPFTRRILGKLGHLTVREFDYFVMHAHHDEDEELIVNMVRAYRSLAEEQRDALDAKIRAHFDKVKSDTAKSVHGNYIKNIQYTMRVIAWCSGFSISPDLVLKYEPD